MPKRILIGLIVAVVIGGAAVGFFEWSAANPFKDGEAAFNRGDYAGAWKLIWPLAEQGNADAQMLLGTMYLNGLGLKEDDVQAEKWVLKAAEQGNADAQVALAEMYGEGTGVPKDNNLRDMWLLKAAEQGVAGAQYYAGFFYSNGLGVPRAPVEGVKWFLKAAEQGNADAQVALAKIYFEGTGVPKDYVSAYMWLELAATREDNKDGAKFGSGKYFPELDMANLRQAAGQSRDEVASKMTPDQIAEAQRLAREWKPKTQH